MPMWPTCSLTFVRVLALNSPTQVVDVVVAGGGPSGLAVAIFARLRGLSVIVLEQRSKLPIDKCCGEGVMPHGVTLIKQMGLEVDVDGVSPYRGITYIEATDPQRLITAQGYFPDEPGLGVRRTHLHQALLARARELGADVRLGTKVTGLSEDGFLTSDGAIVGKWRVAADGLRSPLRNSAGLSVTKKGIRRFGVRRHYAMPPWSDMVEVHLGKNCEAYVTPVGENRVGVALLSSQGSVKYDGLLAQFPQLAARVTGAPVDSSDAGAGPLHQESHRMVEGNFALVGDASGFGDPLTGEGVSLAFRSAANLVEAIVAGDLSNYARAQQSLMRRYRGSVAFALFFTQRPRLRRLVVRLFRRFPTLFNWVLRTVIAL
jgi:flavin-dependent dehydrogenase